MSHDDEVHRGDEGGRTQTRADTAGDGAGGDGGGGGETMMISGMRGRHESRQEVAKANN